MLQQLSRATVTALSLNRAASPHTLHGYLGEFGLNEYTQFTTKAISGFLQTKHQGSSIQQYKINWCPVMVNVARLDSNSLLKKKSLSCRRPRRVASWIKLTIPSKDGSIKHGNTHSHTPNETVARRGVYLLV